MLNGKYIVNFNKAFIPNDFILEIIIYPNNKNYMLLFKQTDDILSVENEKYISNLFERKFKE